MYEATFFDSETNRVSKYPNTAGGAMSMYLDIANHLSTGGWAMVEHNNIATIIESLSQLGINQ